MSNNVFVIQERTDGNGVPLFDLTSALEYGDLVPVLPAGPVSYTPGPMVRKLKEVLREYKDDDYLLLIGDTSAICAACAIVAMNNMGRYNILKWDRRSGCYIKQTIEL